MPQIVYVPKRFHGRSMQIIEQAQNIIQEYIDAGYKLTLRQLYYQFVSRDLIPNKQSEYKKLGSIINDARLAGLIDWEAIEDRGRNAETPSQWSNPSSIIEACSRSYRINLWQGQPERVEVWVEKEALAGIFEDVCDKWHTTFLACKGYTSQSEMWGAAYYRLKDYLNDHESVTVLHFGDHDPSGIYMSRDIEDRLSMFMEDDAHLLTVERIALNIDQVRSQNPPPNPAKNTDTRFRQYAQKFGKSCWELDALDPKYLTRLIETNIKKHIKDEAQWKAQIERQKQEKQILADISNSYEEIVEWLEK